MVEKTGGVAYEFILKQANKENSPAVKRSPATPRQISSESIENKLSEAKERRTVSSCIKNACKALLPLILFSVVGKKSPRKLVQGKVKETRNQAEGGRAQ